MDPRGINRTYEEYDAAVEWSRDADADTVKIFLSGFKREEIRVLVDNHGHLRTRGERLVAGNRWSRFQKDFQLPADCNVDGIRAKFENETLTITLPKKSPSPQAAPVSPPVPATAPPRRPEPRSPATAPPPVPAPPSRPEPRSPATAPPPVPAPPSRPEPRSPATAPAQKPPPAIPEPPTAPPPVPAPPSRPEPRRPATVLPQKPPRVIPEHPTAPPLVPATLPPAPSQKPVPERRPSQPPLMPGLDPEVETHKKSNGGAATTKPGPADVPQPKEEEEKWMEREARGKMKEDRKMMEEEEGVMGEMKTAQQRRPISASRGLLVNVAVAVVVLVGITVYVWHTLRNAAAGGDHGHGKPGARSYRDEM